MFKRYFHFLLFFIFSVFTCYLFVLLYYINTFLLYFKIKEILLSLLFILFSITILGALISFIVFLPRHRFFITILFLLLFIPTYWNTVRIIKLWLFHFLKNIKFIGIILVKIPFIYWILRIFLLLITILLLIYFIRKFKSNFIEEFVKFFSPLPQICFLLAVFSLLIFLPRFFQRDSYIEKYTKIVLNDDLPNIIFIVFDALSSEHMSLYGYKKETTPFIEKFAKDAYVFEPLITVSTYTPPSVMSIYTSLYPEKHKVYGFYQYPSEEVIKEKNMFKYFKNKGYKIFGIIQNLLVHPYAFKLEDYFEYSFFSYFNKYPIPKILYIISLWSREFKIYTFSFIYMFLKNILREYRHGLFYLNYKRETPFPIDAVFREALNILKTEKKPVFLLLHFYCPHDPYLPPGINIPSKFDNSAKQLNYLYRSHPPRDSNNIKILENLYDENIKYLDKEFEKFVEDLKRIKKYDNTLFLITSDHGESFDYRYVGHGAPELFTNELIKVPFIIKTPDSKHKYIKKRGSIIDIFPTLLDVLGFEKPEWVEGISLLDEKENHTYFKCGYYPDENKFTEKLKKSTLCIVKDSLKFYYSMKKDEYSLYNFYTDPYDKKDLSKIYPQKTKEFLELIKKNLYVSVQEL